MYIGKCLKKLSSSVHKFIGTIFNHFKMSVKSKMGTL